MPIVDIEGLTRWYGDFTAVEDLTMTVDAGEVVALLGPNGAGKTTTIRMLMGLLRPTGGRATIAGHDCVEARVEVVRHVGYVPDEPSFHEYLRGSELLRFVADMHGLDGAEARRDVYALAERLGLDDALEEFAVNYSMGMRKKLALIAALLHKPSLLILDEPTSGLDPIATRTLHQMIREYAEAGVAVFHSTHLLDHAEKLCDRVGILHRGRLSAFGALTELRDQLSSGGSLEDVFFEVTEADPEAPLSEAHLPESESDA